MSDQIETPFDIVSRDIEPLLLDIDGLSEALLMMGETIELRGNRGDGRAVSAVARLIREQGEALRTIQHTLFRALHPSREDFDRDGWPGDDDREGKAVAS